MSADSIGPTLGKYRVLEKLGEGGMGAVYRAEDTRLGRHVALKVLPALKTADEEARRRFLTEARAASSLQHPHICVLYEFDEVDGTPFIAMQLVEGETLKQAIASGPIPEERVREIVTAVARALAAAHDKGIVHRDVKPDNILLGNDGSVLLTDFGIARLSQGETLTATDQIVGTPAYMSPEQVRGERVTAASDQFSLGVVAYECITGKPPFAGDNLGTIVHRILNEDAPLPSSLRPGIAAQWDSTLEQALHKDASARHASLAELAGALPRAEAAPAAAVASENSIAILYFENMSSDEESDYFCAGLTEDLLTDLSKVKGLNVASRNAVARYRGQNVHIPQVAADLGVATVLEGSVRKAGNRVRINAQLIKASDGFHLWADRYDRTLDDIFEVQDDITAAIAKELRGALTPDEARTMQSDRPADVRAYDHFLKGMQLYVNYTRAEMHEALAEFEKAVGIEPTYANAWAWLSAACGQMHDKAFDLDPAWLERADEAADRAIELAPQLAQGHSSRALVRLLRNDPAGGSETYEHAVRLDPTNAGTIANLGSARIELGDMAGAERAFRRSTEVDPDMGWGWLALGWMLTYTGRAAEAIETSLRLQRLGGPTIYAVDSAAMRVKNKVRLGDITGAERELSALEALGLSTSTQRAFRAFVERKSVEFELEPPSSKLHYVDWALGVEAVAWGAAQLGDVDRTVEVLKYAHEHDAHNFVNDPSYLRTGPMWANVRHEPAFQEFLGDRGRRLVWASEADPLPDQDRAQFTDYSEASGLPGDDVIP